MWLIWIAVGVTIGWTIPRPQWMKDLMEKSWVALTVWGRAIWQRLAK